MHRKTVAAIILASVMLVTLTPTGHAAAGASHVVRPGETLYGIAREYGVTVHVLAEVNGLSDPTLIRPGQVLRIPTTETRIHRGTEAKAQAPTPKQAAKKKAAPARTVSYRYSVVRGDTLYAIARRFGTTVAALRKANALQSDLIRPGQRLVVPGVKVTPQIPPPGRTIKIKVPIDDETAPSEPVPITAGDTITTERPLRVRRGPGTYFGTLALVAPQTELWVTKTSQGWYEVQLPGGDVGWVREEDVQSSPASDPTEYGRATGDVIVREAMQYLGTRYVWGGKSSRGVDCSGFVYAVFSAFSRDLLRLRSYDYYRMGVPVAQAELLPGDLVFFTTYAPGASHVGIYVGERKFVHASSGAREVAVSSLDESYYTTRYFGARRLAEPIPNATP